MNRTFLPLLLLLLFFLAACGSSKPASTATTTSSSPARPACDAIDEACDAHEGKGGVAKECHDLAESSATPEATCAARKAECLAACPTSARGS